LPAFVLGNSIAGVIMRHTRSAMLQALQSDYVRTARAKGLSERAVVLKHAMRNALTPVITLGALEFGTLLSGAVLTEQIFTIPGFGKLIVDAVFNRDYAVVQGVVLVTATTYILLNLLADLGYILVNPRLARLEAAVTVPPRAPPARSSSQTIEARPARLAAPAQRKGAMVGPRRHRDRGAGRAPRALDRPLRPDPAELVGGPQGAVGGALVRHRRGRAATSSPASSTGARASLLAGVMSVAIAIGIGVPVGPAGRLLRRRRRRGDQPPHRRHAGLPVPDPRHRARGVPGPRASRTP
jgi:hypothetical protein